LERAFILLQMTNMERYTEAEPILAHTAVDRERERERLCEREREREKVVERARDGEKERERERGAP
jgi:hypothetical protein